MKANRFSALMATATLVLPSSLLFGQGFPQQGYPQQAYPQQQYPQQQYPQQGVPQQDLPYDAQGQPAQLLPQQQLENLVAPIALYPDALLSQILVAATYPLEVVEVGQWLQQNRNLQGQNLIAAASQQNWDASIQALVAFPDVVSRLNSDIRWTTDLGNAFLAQQGDVMNAIQVLRQQAQANGRLASNQQQIVTTEAQGPQTVIEILPANPEVVYVPSYDPEYVWGPSPYGYYPSLYYPQFGFSYGYGIPIGGYFGGLGWNSWGWGANWFGGGVIVNSAFFGRYHFNSYRGGGYGYRGGNNWAHNPDHRRGVSYSNSRIANNFRGTTRGDNRGDNRFAGGGSNRTYDRSSGGFSGTSRGFNGSTAGQTGGQRFGGQSSGQTRGSNQFNANRSQVAPSQSQVAPSQGSRFGGNRGTQSFQAPAQNAPAQNRQPFSGAGAATGGGFRSGPRQAAPQTFQAPTQSTPRQSQPPQSFNGGGREFRSSPRQAAPQTFQAPAQSRPSQSFNGGGGGGFRSNQRSAPPQSFQAPAQRAPAQTRQAPSGGGQRGNGGGGQRGNGGGGQRGGSERSSRRG